METDPTRDQVFDFLVQFKTYNDGNSPSISEISRALTIGRSTVQYHLRKLCMDGRISREGTRIFIEGGKWRYRKV